MNKQSNDLQLKVWSQNVPKFPMWHFNLCLKKKKKKDIEAENVSQLSPLQEF